MSVINRNHNLNSKVEFISYDGQWPNLCRGVLVLRIDGKEYKFGHDYSNLHWHEDIQQWVHEDEDPANPNYESFWKSGGSYGFETKWTNEYIHTGEWEIDVDELPEELWEYADEIDSVINENIPQGCCGGCL